MERQQGENELLLTCRDEGAGVCILRCASADPVIRVPDAVLDRPVVSLGRYALSQRDPELTGAGLFQVRVTGGNGDRPVVHDAGGLVHVLLPASLRRVGDYAFYNCRSLARLSLSGGVEELGGDALMNCAALRRIDLTLDENGKSCLQGLLAACSTDLEVRLTTPRGKAVLSFPAYREELELVRSAHIFQRRIQGSGYAYRQCFRDGVPDLPQYDGCFSRLLEGHDYPAACRVALDRLRWPLALSDAARDAYLAFLREHGGLAASELLDRNDGDGLAFLLELKVLSPAALTAAGDAARQAGRTGALALLLEALRPAAAPGRHKSFDL